ncbi:tRNA-specific adenosine deaminase [Taibaiella sp. KBW10]|uniref:nucleoside deaminase n=1 Tax=Taibaiella sp. KBW10 TaxID=2153357 RepID=UPI000F59A44A|nr:nucleoside deaminase [Taibaiella sp. KBW10]RQO30297.1 tRNA-specific adenosine deaminase [Taibaiella sp. KBW10]
MTDEHFMQQALKEARRAYELGEIPIGAVVVWNDRIISRGHNQTEQLNDCTAHAEMIALTSAFNEVGAKYLTDATIYVTIEPCLMCCGALYWSKMGRVVYGGGDVKNGYKQVIGEKHGFHPKTQISYGVLADECISLMKDFFVAKR